MKYKYFNKFILVVLIIIGQNLMADNKLDNNVYDFSFEKLNGETINLKDYKDKVLLIVNTASKCGFTNQYSGLEKLYKKYKDQGLVIIAVPSNDFLNQEPGSDKDIQEFCKINYGVSFLVTKKQRVKGQEAHPFYKLARTQLGFFAAPKWNFHKYLINKNGVIVDYFYSTTKPDNPKIINAIEKNLNISKHD